MTPPIDLSAREFEVLQCLAQGMMNKEIARQLVISENTVEQHLRHIYAKLNLSNRAEACRWYCDMEQKR